MSIFSLHNSLFQPSIFVCLSQTPLPRFVLRVSFVLTLSLSCLVSNSVTSSVSSNDDQGRNSELNRFNSELNRFNSIPFAVNLMKNDQTHRTSPSSRFLEGVSRLPKIVTLKGIKRT